MSAKDVKFGESARVKLLQGVNTLAASSAASDVYKRQLKDKMKKQPLPEELFYQVLQQRNHNKAKL